MYFIFLMDKLFVFFLNVGCQLVGGVVLFCLCVDVFLFLCFFCFNGIC